MKLHLSQPSGRLRVKSLPLLISLFLSPLVVMATDPIFINTGTISGTPPNVDATNFFNSGIWDIGTSIPYETAHTLNYTNVGTMTGSVGWEFDYGPLPLGGRGMSANFFNDSPATIEADDASVNNPPNNPNATVVSYLLVSATNIVNKGTLIVGPHGVMALTGENVTLSRSTMETAPVVGQGSSNGSTNFSPEVQVYSLFWGTNNMSLASSNLWDGTNVLMVGTNQFPLSFLVSGNGYDVPSYSNLQDVETVYNSGGCGASNVQAQLVPFAPAAGSDSVGILAAVTNVMWTNMYGNPQMTIEPVKIIKQAVFFNINDANLTGAVRFSPSSNPTNFAQTVAVRLTGTSTNVITLLPQTTSIYLVDTLMSETNSGLNISTNTFDPFYYCLGPIYRPANYNVERIDLGGHFANGIPGAGLPPANFFSTGSNGYVVSNDVVSVNYADCAAYIDNLSADQQSGVVVSNLGGRITINADNLDLTRADLVAGGDINIQANNLVSSTNAVVSCQNLSYHLGSTNGNLNFTRLGSLSIPEFQGNIVAWSATWTNYTTEVISGAGTYDTNSTPPFTSAPITNYTEVDFYILIVDASSLSSQASVTVQDLILHGTNITVSDNMMVPDSFLLDGQTFTLLGELYLYGSAQNWAAANAPTLRYFTNYNFLYVQNNAHFGDDTAAPYVEFVNHGEIESGSQTIDSLDIQIADGINYTRIGDFSAMAQSIEITGPTVVPYWIYTNSIYSADNINFFANTLLMDSADLYAGGALNFNVTNSLSDNGTASLLACYNGFNLWLLPTNGDLPGSTITSIASLDREEILHAWAGKDYGPSTAGFNNNVAIGTLVLSAQNPNTNSAAEDPLFHFYGTGVSNGLYVTTLDLSQLTTRYADVASMIQVDPNLKIYFYDVVLGFTPPGGQTPADFMTNQFPGAIVPIPGGTNAPVAITVNALDNNRHAISPLIYGVGGTMNPGDLPDNVTSNQLADLNFTVNRSGGNEESRYNWQINAHNHAGDWYFESIADGTSTTPGATADAFVASSKNGGAQPMMTIPMIGWLPVLGAGRSTLWSYSINKYGPQTATAPDWPDAGNGILLSTGRPITWNNYFDANFLTNSVFQKAFVQHLTNHWGSSTNGGVRFYSMDNEPSIWFQKHQDVHPTGPKMQEIWNDMLTYASVVKSNDPNALICGPEEWGWLGYFYSGYDQQWASSNNYPSVATYPDRSANGGWDYIPWLLNKFNQYSITNTANTNRLLDYVTVHCYPQENNVFGDAVDRTTKLLRNRSTRQLWDTNYTDQSWINSVIKLIPRMKNWVTNYYPGTKIGITEYNWGADADINGATAQADVLGILGREGVDLAARWGTPATNTPTYRAMKMYRNYDGSKSTFGDVSIPMVMPNPDNLSAFCAVRTNDGAMTFMAINKDLRNATPIVLNIAGFNARRAHRWQLSSTNAITLLGDIIITNGVLSDVVPAQSITLYVLPSAGPLQFGSLQVTITPAAAVSAGAQWQVDGGTLQNSGTTVSNLLVGAHTVSFSTINGWATPTNQSVVISSNQTSTVSANYSAAGSLQVTISPAGAVSAGAMWQVDGGAFQNSGSTLSNLSVGSHTLAFKPITDWSTPASQAVTITASQTTTATGTYVNVSQTGSLQVMISPPGAITAGAMWQVDGGAFQISGAIVSSLSATSNHTVAYEAVNGFITPANQSLAITAGLTSVITGVYVSTDTNRPTIAITAPLADQSVSNVLLFTVTGTAAGKVPVAGVYYTFDNSPWTNATTGNHWTNWSAAVTLIPGTNTIAAYAVDNNGNVSTTNKVSFVCVLTAPLSVSTNGLGSLSPDDNGALLQIGKSYSITATPAKGFAFTNWMGGTNLPLSVITNNVTIQFLMRSNLMLQANFKDVTRPTNTITTPAAGQHMTSALATVLGTATDNWRVSGVWYQLNDEAWSRPSPPMVGPTGRQR